MSRPRRCGIQGAIQLVTIRGYPGGCVFYDPVILKRFPENPRGHAPDEEHFEQLLWEVCEQYDARVHAYFIESNAAFMVMQPLGAPLPWIMHDLIARFSAHLLEEKRIPEGTRPFPRRYKAQIVQPTKLPYAVRYVQRKGLAADARRRAINHPFSSHLIYCGRRPRPECFVAGATLGALENLGYLGPNAYFEFMARADSPSIAHMLSQHIIGEKDFAEGVRKRSREPPRAPSPDDILEAVTSTLLNAGPELACQSTHRGALARALVAWYAMRTGAAQIGTVARWFGVTSSDLRYLIRRHRRKNPGYFSMSLLDLFPTLSVRAPGTLWAHSGDSQGAGTRFSSATVLPGP